MTEARGALVQDQKSPDREARLLKVMDTMEAAKGELGLSCETVGEGKDRAVAMRIPVQQQLAEPALVQTWVTEYGYPNQKHLPMGTMYTTRNEYMVVNRAGVLKVVTTPNQQVAVDPTAEYFSVKHDMTPDRVREWVGQASSSVQWFTEQGERRYQGLLDGHQYPAQPTTPEYTRDYNEAVRRNMERQERGFDYMLGSAMAPEGEWAKFVYLDDTVFD